MKILISKEALLDAISDVAKGIPQHADRPVLAGVLVSAGGGCATFEATDLVKSVRSTAAAIVNEPGRAVLPGRLLVEIAKSLPDATVCVEAGADRASITCEQSSFTVRSLDPSDFPAFPEVEPEQRATVPFAAFSSMAKKVCRAASRDEGRAVLTGVHVSVEDGTLKLAATDSYRLAVAERDLDGECGPFEAVLPASFVSELASMADTGEAVTIALSGNQVVVEHGDTTLVNRRIEGNYPNYARLVPAECATRCTADRDRLAAAVRRATLLSPSDSRVRVTVDPGRQELRLDTAQSAGTTSDIVAVEAEGDPIEVGFSGLFLSEGLAAVDAREVSIELQGPQMPGVLKAGGAERFLYLVMPMMC